MSRSINNLQLNLSRKQKHTLDYWRIATTEIESTCLSVLNLFYRNDDYVNYLKYQRQFHNFKDIRSILSNIVLKTVETNNLFLMESVVLDSVKQLMNMIVLKSSRDQLSIGNNNDFRSLYNEIALIIIKCMLILKSKLRDVDEYLNKIPYQRIKYETEALQIVKTLDVFANRLNFMLKMTSKVREDENEEIAKSVVQSIELIITSVQSITLDSRGNKGKFLRRTRNVWSLVNEKTPTRLDNTFDTSQFIEKVLNDSNLRFRDKLKALKAKIKCSVSNHAGQEDLIPFGWIHPTDEQIEEYICKNGGCPTNTLQTNSDKIENQAMNARERFTLEELIKLFPVDTQHLRFPPNPSNASVFKSQLQSPSQTDAIDEDLLEGLLWQWHEVSDSESTISIRFKFEMSDTNRREKWLRGIRRWLQLDTATMDLFKREIEMVNDSKMCAGQDSIETK